MKSLTTLFILFLHVQLSQQTPFCDQNNPTMSPNDPAFPQPFDQYIADVEVTMSELSHTLTVRQYVDRPGNRSALYIYENGQQQIVIVDFPSNQLFNIKDGVCNVSGISASNYSVGLADYILEGLLFDPVHQNDPQNKMYMQPTKVRGITVDHWKTCPFINKLRANYTLDYYFSTAGWDGPEVSQTPVQKVADGDRMLTNGSMIHFRHIFDIVDFKPNIDDNTVFMTPIDVVCVGRRKTRTAPTLSNHVHFVQENRVSRTGPVSYSEIWYDYEKKLARYDTRSPVDSSFIPAHTSIAMVHDFNYGISYTRDRVSGRCLAKPLNVSVDDTFHPVSINRTQTIQMDTPGDLLRVNNDLTFTGQRYIRSMLCDEYESQQINYGTSYVVKHYFLAQGMRMLPDDSGGVSPTVLVRATFFVPSTGYYYRMDLLKYDEDIPDISVFDVTPCYSKAAQVQLSVTFQGYYQFGLREQLQTKGRKQLQLALGVSPMRLPTVSIDYDRSFVYIKAWLLEKSLDIGTITGPPEINVTQAYDNLVNAVNNGTVQVKASMSFVKDPMVFTAVDVNVIFGFLRTPQFPNIQAQFSYHLENSVPKLKTTFNSHIWYDYQYKLVRYDITRQGGDPMENIHDYNTGLAYEINRASGECFVGPIGPKSYDVVPQSQSAGGYVLKMRNPIQFLDLSQNFVYTGQKTVRERLCNVYESVANFSFGGTNKLAVHQFYSSSSAWHQLSEGSSQAVVGQPMRMIVTAADSSETEIFDFMDFNQEDPDLSNFNIQPCYRKSNQQAHFSIIFHNTAGTGTDKESFRKMAQLMLAEVAGISPLRLQNPQLTLFRTVIGYIATLVQQAPAILDFTKTTNKQSMYSSDATFPKVASDDECAGICRNMTSFACESFDYCPTSGLCQLSKNHTSDGNKLQNSAECHHYSRTVNGEVHIEPTNDQALTMWQDRVDRGTLQLKLASGNQNPYVVYPATRLMRDVLRFDSMTAINADLDHFTRQYATEPPKYSNAAGSVVSIETCAQTCLTEVTFECQSFLYCPIYGYCRPVPDYLVKNSTNSGDDLLQCYAFSRRYTDSYVSYPGYLVTHASGHVILKNVLDVEMCAKKCSHYSSFPCKSFEYCATSKDCFISKDHRIISPTDVSSTATTTTMSCSHFSKKYLYDFKKTPKKSLLSSQVLTFFNESIESCARLCVENSGYSCESFTYCASITTCSVTSAITSSSRAHVAASESCDLYTRVYKTGSPPAHQTQTKPKAEASGFGSGMMAAVAIVMLLVGMVVGAGFLYFCRTKAIVERLQTLELKTVNPLMSVDDQS